MKGHGSLPGSGGAAPVGHGQLVADPLVPQWLRRLTRDVGAVTDAVAARGGYSTRMAALSLAGRAVRLGRRDAAVRLGRRDAAVLILFSGDIDADPGYPGGVPDDAHVVLLQRAAGLRNHGGQVAFPGGARDPGDDFPVGTAIREAVEETAVDPTSVRPIALLHSFPVPPSGFDVTPVIAHWINPGAIRVVDVAETARVARIRVRDLLDPGNRFMVERRVAGRRVYKGPAFGVDGLVVWGFTGGLLSAIATGAGWDVPWNTHDVRELSSVLAEPSIGESDAGSGAGGQEPR